MDENRNPDPGSSRTRSSVFRYPVIYPDGLLYYKTFAAAEFARQRLVISRLTADGQLGGSHAMRLKRRSMKGRMG